MPLSARTFELFMSFVEAASLVSFIISTILFLIFEIHLDTYIAVCFALFLIHLCCCYLRHIAVDIIHRLERINNAINTLHTEFSLDIAENTLISENTTV